MLLRATSIDETQLGDSMGLRNFFRPRAAGPVARKISRVTTPTGVERTFDRSEVIVTKTNRTGHITYANDIFLRIAGYTEAEVMGAPHSIIRHPDMPRCVFKYLWDTIEEGQDVFAYVLNLASTGDHYWVFAHVTPSYGRNRELIGYHSSRRSPDRRIVKDVITPLYQSLLAEEKRHKDRKAGLEASFAMLCGALAKKGTEYDEFILSL